MFRFWFKESWGRIWRNTPIWRMLNWRCIINLFDITSTWIMIRLRIVLTSLCCSIGIMWIFIMMIIKILLFGTDDSMLSIKLVWRSKTLKLLLRVMSINCSWFEVFRGLGCGWQNLRRILCMYFTLLFKGCWTIGLFDLLSCFPFIFRKHVVLIAHSSKIIYKLS